MGRWLATLALAYLSLGAASPPNWRTPDPARLLVIDTSKGRVVIEMEPRIAPRAVERVTLLARRGTYDGLLFHRVIDGFVAQFGNPNNRDGGKTELPNLKQEFWFYSRSGPVTWLRTTDDGQEGVFGALPVAKGSLPQQWVASCKGMIGMGHDAEAGTANSELYINRANTRELDHDFTLFGRVLAGQSVVDALAVGEPPANPDRMIRVRIAADMPVGERPRIAVMDTGGAAFRHFVAERTRARGAALSVCDLTPPTREQQAG